MRRRPEDAAVPTETRPVVLEHELLDVFWYRVSQGEDRLKLLREFASYVVDRPPDWDKSAIRADAMAHPIKAEHCFVCLNGDRRLYAHHVIQIQHGGSNTVRNRLVICYRDHASIHPWMPPTRRGEDLRGEWWALDEIGRDIHQREGESSDALEDIQRRGEKEPSAMTNPSPGWPEESE